MNNISTIQRNINFILFILFLLFSTIVNDAVAQDNANADIGGITKIFCNVINQITGSVGKVISVLILISMAIGLFLGKITWGLAIAVMVGMGLLFGAKGLVDVIASGTAADATTAVALCQQG